MEIKVAGRMGGEVGMEMVMGAEPDVKVKLEMEWEMDFGLNIDMGLMV